MDESEKHKLNHFSHQHPLESIVSDSTGNLTCNGCNLEIMSCKDYYHCKTCSFSLHRICSNMPRKTRHPSHPNHYLTLLVSPSSLNNNITTSNCNACGHHISGFYYNCAECSIYYHILCSALPFSVAISSHPHTLRIEFSPPYNFCCDLCDKPSHFGWLYRCRFCEFDAHISCAISDHKAQTVPPSNTLTRQILYSASIVEANRMIDYGIESSELMQLVVQGVALGNQLQESNGEELIAQSSAAIGWDERLQSPKLNNGIGRFRLYQSESQMSSSSTTPSYQFSDLCFSIDLLKSYASQDHNRSLGVNKEASFRESEGVSNNEVEAKVDHDNKIRQQEVVDYPNGPVFNPLYKAPENWLNDESLLETVKYGNDGCRQLAKNEDNGKVNRFGGVRPRINDRTMKSNMGSSRWSCWWKLLGCCYSTRYEKCSKSFKNGGL